MQSVMHTYHFTTLVLYYLHRDYLGSITMVTDANGNKEAEYSYTAWGQLRNPTNWQSYNAGNEPTLMFGRGYTGHEHLHAFGLINMNARLYDASIGRFLSPDPYVQAPDFTQNFNRYSYCLNNPLIYTDPSGEIVLGLLRGLGDAIFSGGLELWNWGDDYTKDAWSKADPFKPGTAGNNSARIWGGLFAADTDQSGWGWQIVSRFTRELPQTLMGFTGSHAANLFGEVESVEYYDGATILTGDHDNLLWGLGGPAMTLGSYIIGNNETRADPNNAIFQHEYGHVLQSRDAGLRYLGQYALPSLFSKNNYEHFHSDHPVEQDANARAFLHFNKKDNTYSGWFFAENPINGYNRSMPYDGPTNLSVLNGHVLSPAKWYVPGVFSLYYIFHYRNIQP